MRSRDGSPGRRLHTDSREKDISCISLSLPVQRPLLSFRPWYPSPRLLLQPFNWLPPAVSALKSELCSQHASLLCSLLAYNRRRLIVVNVKFSLAACPLDFVCLCLSVCLWPLLPLPATSRIQKGLLLAQGCGRDGCPPSSRSVGSAAAARGLPSQGPHF